MAYKCNTLIHVGNLPPYIREEEVEQLFFNLGQVTLGMLRDCKTTTYAFVQFEDSKTAEDAVIARDGYEYHGFRLEVELVRSNGPKEFQTRSRPHKYTAVVSGLPPTASWQGLKDHMKNVGYVCYASVYNDGTGIVDFLRYEDMKNAVKKLDGSRFISLQGEISLIRVREDHSGSVGYGQSTSGSDYYRVLVTGLPPTGSWQDLKYHMSEAGRVYFAWVFHDGTGIVDFLSYEAMRYALWKLDGSRFISKQGESSHIRVREDPSGSGGYRSPVPDRNESHEFQSRSRSPGYIKEENSEVNDHPSKDIHKSYGHERSRSRSRSSGYIKEEHSEVKVKDHPTKDRSESYGHGRSRSRSRSSEYVKKEHSEGRYDSSTKSRDGSLGKRGVTSRSRSPRYVGEEPSEGEGSDSPHRNRSESYGHGRSRSRSRSPRYVKEEHSEGEGSGCPRRNIIENYGHGRSRSRSRSSRYVKEVSRYDRLAKERSESPEKGGPRNRSRSPIYAKKVSRYNRSTKERGGPVNRRDSQYYGVTVTGLPPTSSWQDLKNHMRVAGYVCFASVYNDGTGRVQYLKYEDMKNAVKKLNGSRFRSSQRETSHIRVKEDLPKDQGCNIQVMIEWEPKTMEKDDFEVEVVSESRKCRRIPDSTVRRIVAPK